MSGPGKTRRCDGEGSGSAPVGAAVGHPRSALGPAAHRTLWVGVAVLATLAACKGQEEVEDVATTRRGLPPLLMLDTTPPAPTTWVMAEVVEPGVFRLEWAPGRDDRTPQERLRYELQTRFPAWDPARPPRVVYVTEPGETSVLLAYPDPLPWPLEIVVVDEEGNRSAASAGVRLPTRGSFRSAESGLPSDVLQSCASLTPGQFVCTGGAGSVMLWERDRWRVLAATSPLPLRAVAGGQEVWLFNDVGELHTVGLDGEMRPVDVVLEPATPESPFLAEVRRDSFGLLHWVDGVGARWWGIPPVLRRVDEPLALPEEVVCRRARALVHTARQAVAVCEEGQTFVARLTQPPMRWFPVAERSPEGLRARILGAFEGPDGAAIVVSAAGVYALSRGDWRVLWEAGAPEGTVHAYWADPAAGVYYLATHIGLWEGRGSGEPRRVFAGPVVGVGPPSALHPQDVWWAVTPDARVLRGPAGGTLFRPEHRSPVVIGYDPRGRLLALMRSGMVARWVGPGRWEDVAAAPAGGSWSGLGGLGASLILWGEQASRGLIYVHAGGGWREKVSLGGAVPGEEDVLAVPRSWDGAFLGPGGVYAWAGDVVWREGSDGRLSPWRRLPGRVLAMVEDSEAAVVVTERGYGACREEGCAFIDGSPEEIVVHWRGPEGLCFLDPFGARTCFVERQDGSQETQVHNGGAAQEDPRSLRMVLYTEQGEVHWRDDGQVGTHVGGLFRPQGRVESALGLVLLEGGAWGVVGPQGVVQYEAVRIRPGATGR